MSERRSAWCTTGRTELLAPAKDLACGRTAIDCGADAVYIGAPRFGARAKAGNNLAAIEALVRYAHVYWARVYATVNTLLFDDELAQAVRLIHQLDEIGVDGVIIQDMGLLESDLPPLPLIASTQMHNHTPKRVAFLEQVGFQRAILARELSLTQIAAIRAQTSIELESFVHGALCVCYSGQCTMSYAIGGRSGNRGECAQPCRRRYSLVDAQGDVLVEGRHLLSLRDMNRSAYLGDLIEAGVTSFKIEGRLKDAAYVANVVSHYRRRLDQVLADQGLQRSSSGRSRIDFTPDVDKTFNRGYTPYFIDGKHVRGGTDSPGAIETPKMVGEFMGTVIATDRRSFILDRDAPLHNGDGICFFTADGELDGTTVNGVRGRKVFPHHLVGITESTRIYRNHDHRFLTLLAQSQCERKIAVRLHLGETARGFALTASDEDGNTATSTLETEKVAARKPQQALDNARQQLQKTGETPFVCRQVTITWQAVYFLPFSALNDLRRRVLETLVAVRARNRPVVRRSIHKNEVAYPETRLSYLGNVLNQKAAAFYRRHGVVEIEPAAESGLDMAGKRVMRTRYCIKHQLGLCPQQEDAAPLNEPLYLVDAEGRKYELRFDCAACEMVVYF